MARAFVLGDDVNTDLLAPGAYMTADPAELASHCLEALDPNFAREVRRGDVVVAGRNFGAGSSREQAAVSLQLLGVSAILAKSFARIFYRNAINLGMPAIQFPFADEISGGDEIVVDLEAGEVRDLTTGLAWSIDTPPDTLMDMIRAGGLLPHLKRRLARREYENE